jgi:predicted NAD/FAD-dependent oxidoreductase
MSIAIIGAGLAGLVAARKLVAAGQAVTLFEKSGGRGGRIATRRTDEAAFDHGAPLLHGIGPNLAQDAGAVPWRDGVIGRPGNSSLGRALAAGLDLRDRTRITGLRAGPGGWRLETEGGPEAGPFARVLAAIPAPQAQALLGPLAAHFPGLGAVTMAPALTLMARFKAPAPGPDWRDDLPAPLGLAIRNSAKPDRPPAEAWVIHADPAFSLAALEAPPDETAPRLAAAFCAATGAEAPAETLFQRWRYARTTRPLGAACLWSAELGLGLTGDWCLGPDAGDAAASGAALAASVLAAG